ncbi:helix-turn-helix transcriptional regulator [Streptomyces sp. DSM 44915]|uniref:Helix-turn-helix transcriptional regulator n=1 Tax=Streptomyces chisholmiae TaxID=3075540 RepID=A0ABU2JUA2_9ACTN|nr:helix-turn-helix transcriptional regulator [Streptomyces sp. DSM 44915]MDT0268318.1 helix-turn-helix transcriptional regulator [Streptomyces sp. DSM 44915]
MTAEERRAFGARVAKFRRGRGMAQTDLAREIGRTASWVSQVERGVQPVVRLDVLQLLAEGLGVSVQLLQPDAPLQQEEAVDQASESNDLDAARLLISGHPALGALLGGHIGRAPKVAELTHAVDEVWALTHASRFAELSASLEGVLGDLEVAARTTKGSDQRAVQKLLSQTYQALSAAFVRQDEADAAWVAADRAVRAAEMSGEPLAVGAGIFRLAQAFVRLKRYDQAEHAAATAVSALESHTAGEAVPEALSVLGALHLALALVCARAGRRVDARAHLDRARAVAQRLGEDRNDFNLEFGPTNVEVQAVSTAVELGDAGEAIDLGRSVDTAHLSTERRSRLLMDLGRAYTQRRQIGEALDCLLKAEELAPETVRSHVAARASIRELVLIAGRTAPAELLSLAERADATA